MAGKHRQNLNRAVGGRRLAAAGATYTPDAAAGASQNQSAQELVDGLHELLNGDDTTKDDKR